MQANPTQYFSRQLVIILALAGGLPASMALIRTSGPGGLAFWLCRPIPDFSLQ